MPKIKYSLLFLTIFLTSCEGNNINSSLSNSSSISTISKELKLIGRNTIGLSEYVNLKVTLNDEEIIVDDVNFSSSDKSIITVSSSGIVKGISKGKATITCSLKNDPSVSSSLEFTVVESLVPQNVINRFIYNASYKLNVNGTFDNKEFNMEERIYSSSMYYHDKDYYFGYGNSLNGVYQYEIKNDAIANATYTRESYQDFKEAFFDLTDLRSFSFPTSLQDNDSYEIDNSTLKNYFIYEAVQFSMLFQKYSRMTSDLKQEIMTITSDSSFDVTLYFENEQIKLSYTLEDKNSNDQSLTNYLNNNSIQYPEVYKPLEELYQVSQSHNYYRDFGQYTFQNGTKIDMGKILFTEKYIFYDYNLEYMNQFNKDADEDKKITRHGAIELHNDTYDGVYEFTINKDSANNETITIGKKVTNNGNSIKHYYDYYENLSLILKDLSNELFRFDRVSSTSFKSDSNTAKYFANILFSDYVQALSVSASYLLLDVNYKDKIDENTKVDFGASFTLMGQSISDYSNYSYTGFNTVTYKLLDDYLNNK